MIFAEVLGGETTAADVQLRMHREWFAGLEFSAKYLEACWHREVGTGLPRMPDGFRALARFAMAHRNALGDVKSPLWLEHNSIGELPLSAAGARLLDGVVANFAQQIQNEFGGAWELHGRDQAAGLWNLRTSGAPGAGAVLRTVVLVAVELFEPPHLDGLLYAYSRERGLAYDPTLYEGEPFAPDEDLFRLDRLRWNSNADTAPAAWPSGEIRLVSFEELTAASDMPNIDELVELAVGRGESADFEQILEDEFTHVIQLFSHLEHYVGEDARDDLEDTLLAEDGVVATSGEDREWIYLNAPELTTPEALALVRRVVTRLAREYDKR